MMTFGPVLARELLHLVEVDAVVVAPHAVRDDREPAARHVDRRAVGQVAAGRQIEAHERVARLHQRHERGRVGGGAGMGLHVGEGAAEQFGDPVDRELLGDVDVLAAAVVALAGQSFGVLVGEHRALRFQHRAAHDVLRRDQLDLVALAAELAADHVGDLGIGVAQRGREQVGVRRSPKHWSWTCAIPSSDRVANAIARPGLVVRLSRYHNGPRPPSVAGRAPNNAISRAFSLDDEAA